MGPVGLRTARLVLDQPGDDDIDAIAAYCADPLFERYMSTPWPYSRADAEGFVGEFVPAGWASGVECTWAIRDPDAGALLGMIGTRDKADGVWDVGFWLGAPHRGRGLVREAATAVLDWAFSTLDCRVIRWEAVVGNAASLAVARGLGFRYTGVAPGFVGHRDGSHPHSWHAALRAGESREPKAGWPT